VVEERKKLEKTISLKNKLHEAPKAISSAYRKIVLGGTTGRRTLGCGGLYLFRGIPRQISRRTAK
jgi:hypothetical protein